MLSDLPPRPQSVTRRDGRVMAQVTRPEGVEGCTTSTTPWKNVMRFGMFLKKQGQAVMGPFATGGP
jgi:hypothetical protein